jgi:hypothetical protein
MLIDKFQRKLKSLGVLFRYSARGLQAGVGIALSGLEAEEQRK